MSAFHKAGKKSQGLNVETGVDLDNKNVFFGLLAIYRAASWTINLDVTDNCLILKNTRECGVRSAWPSYREKHRA